MPEGPEVKYIASNICDDVCKTKLKDVKINKGRYVTHGPPANYHKFVSALPLKLEKVDTKGKVLFFYFDGGWCMISRLGLSGWWWTKYRPTWRKESRDIEFTFTNNQVLTYSDQLHYGTLTFIHEDDTESKPNNKDNTKLLSVIEKEVDKIGLDIMSSSTTYVKFKERLETIRNRAIFKHPIEELITDQKILISGVGNYLKAEVLYDAKIAPHRHSTSLDDSEWKRLFHSIKKVSARMYDALTSSHGTKDTDKYMNAMKVYRKKEDPLGNKIANFKNSSGRTTYWVPAIQK